MRLLHEGYRQDVPLSVARENHSVPGNYFMNPDHSEVLDNYLVIRMRSFQNLDSLLTEFRPKSQTKTVREYKNPPILRAACICKVLASLKLFIAVSNEFVSEAVKYFYFFLLLKIIKEFF